MTPGTAAIGGRGDGPSRLDAAGTGLDTECADGVAATRLRGPPALPACVVGPSPREAPGEEPAVSERSEDEGSAQAVPAPMNIDAPIPAAAANPRPTNTRLITLLTRRTNSQSKHTMQSNVRTSSVRAARWRGIEAVDLRAVPDNGESIGCGGDTLPMPVVSPVSERRTVVALLLLTFATGLVDSVSVLFLGHVFVANMTGNVIFLGFWFVPHSGIDMGAALVAFISFLLGTIVGGRFARYYDSDVRRWLTMAMSAEVVVLLALSVLAGAGVLHYHDSGRLILIAGLALAFGAQAATARQFGIQELSTTVLTSTLVGLGADSRLAGGSGEREMLRYRTVLTMLAGAAVGATLTRFAVAPVIGLAALVVAASLAVFHSGKPPRAADR